MNNFNVLIVGALLSSYLGTAKALSEYNPAYHARAADVSDTGRVIVRFKQDSALLRKHALSVSATASETLLVATARAEALSERLGMSLGAGRTLNVHTQVLSAAGINSAMLAERLAAQADVEYAVPDQRRTHFALPNDPWYGSGPPVTSSTGGPVSGQWYLRAPSGEIVSSINAPDAWDFSTGSQNIVVAMLDSGVRPEHPDLANRLLPGADMITDMATANDGNGRDSDASDPGDWISPSESYNRRSQFYQCGASDSSWHGTMTASLVGAASNNGVGMSGVAWGVKLLPVRVLGKCGGYDSDIIAGMQWAAGLPVPDMPLNPNPARVLNLSLGSIGTCPQSYIDAINSIIGLPDSVTIVVAAGNDGGAVSVPANCPGVIGVTGLRHAGTKVGFSNMGPEISISAPGGNCVNTDASLPCLYPILAATNTGLTNPVASAYTDSFNTSIGTSFSTPLVAGTVALMLSVQPGLTLTEIKSVLQSTARPFPVQVANNTPIIPECTANNSQLECYCTTATCGAGMLDTAAAVAAAIRLRPSSLLIHGWNLLGNSVQATLQAAAIGSAAHVSSVWKWLPSKGNWAFYTPWMTAHELAAYVLEKGYDPLTTINPGEGFWVNAKIDFSAQLPVGAAVSSASFINQLPANWSLLAVGDNPVPRDFVSALFPLSSASSPITLWAWDSTLAQWYFYAPGLDHGSVLVDYTGSKGYLDFATQGRTLSPATGFWVNHP